MNKSPRALALEAQPFNPALLTIAGDATTPNGLRYVNTFLNDYRNPDMISWSPAHEALVLSLAQTARPSGSVNVPTGEPDGVILMGDDKLVEDGRQRRRCSIVFNARLSWIADVFMTQTSTEELTIDELRKRLLDFGPDGESPAVYTEGGDDTILPSQICSGSFDAPRAATSTRPRCAAGCSQAPRCAPAGSRTDTSGLGQHHHFAHPGQAQLPGASLHRQAKEAGIETP